MNLEFHSLDLPAQVDVLKSLLKQGFPESNESELFSSSMLDWKFVKSTGFRHSFVGSVDNSPVSFYGVLPRQYTFKGTTHVVGLVVDVLSIPEMRGRGLFVSSGHAVMKQLEESKISCVIGFPIRPEVLPGHLKVGWHVRFIMPVYVYPIGSRKESGWPQKIIGTLFRVLYIALSPLRFAGKVEVQESSGVQFAHDPRVEKFMTDRPTNCVISLQKNPEFLKWRLSRPDATYSCFTLGEDQVSAFVVSRVMDFEGFQTLAILDIDGSSKIAIKRLMAYAIRYARDEKCDLIAFCSNKSNFKRLGLRRIGFLNSLKKFRVITRTIGDSTTDFTEKFSRLTWMDSDTL